MNTGNSVLRETQHNIADLDCFKTLILQEILKTQSQHQVILCIFGSRTLVPMSWMCKKQTSVSHSSTESEITSHNAGLRMEGILVRDLWDLLIEVFHSSPNQTNKTKDVREPRRNLSAKITTKHSETDSNHAHQSGSDQY